MGIPLLRVATTTICRTEHKGQRGCCNRPALGPPSLAMSKDDILVARDGGIATVTFNRPEKRNACSLAMWQRLGTLFAELGRDAEVRTVILTGAGGHFCAGADISEFETVRASAKA